MGYCEREKVLIKFGICLDCKLANAAPRNRRCDLCRLRLNRRARDRYRQRMNLPTCPSCKDGRLVGDSKICKNCQAQREHKRWVNYWTKRGKLPASS